MEDKFEQILILGSGENTAKTARLTVENLEELRDSNDIEICVILGSTVQILTKEQLKSLMEEIEDIANIEMPSEKLDLIQYPIFDLNKFKQSFNQKQRNRQIAFKDTNALCKNVLKNNRFWRGRR